MSRCDMDTYESWIHAPSLHARYELVYQFASGSNTSSQSGCTVFSHVGK